MKILTNNTISGQKSFSGLYEFVGTTTKVLGCSYHDKMVYKVNNFLYHPFKNETASEIATNITRAIKGKTFSLIEKEHFHTEGDYYFLNNIKLGKVIDKPDKKLKSFYKNVPVLMSNNKIYDIYNNFAYGVMDLCKLSKKACEAILKFNK